MAIPIGNLKGSFDFSDVSSYPGTGSTLFDLSAANNDLTNTTLSGTFGGTGQSKYYTFAGGADQFWRNNTGLGVTQLFTASQFMWVRSTDWTDGVGAYRCMSGWGEDIGTGGGQIGIWKQQSASFYPPGASAAMGSGWATTFYPGGLTNNTWMHLGYVVDGTDAKIYLDGVLVGSIPQANSYTTGPTGTTGFISNNTAPYYAPMTLGGLYSNYYPASGFDVAVAEFYDVALSGTQALELFNSQEYRFTGGPPPPPPLPAPIAQYDFSDVASYPGTGGTLYDLSGTGNTLTNPTLSGTFGGTGQSKYYSFAGGADQFYKDAAAGFAGTQLFTGSHFIWVKSSDWNNPPQSGASNYMTGWGLDTGSGGGHLGFAKQLPAANYPAGAKGSMGSGFGVTSFPGGLTNNDWLHLGYVADGTDCNLYLNGNLVGSIPQDWQGAYPPYFGPTGILGFIGRDPLYAYTPWITLGGLYSNYGPSSNYDIAIAEFYNVGFASTQVLQLYNSQVARFPAPPPPPYVGSVGGRNFGGRFAG